jgi:hypothetical protein
MENKKCKIYILIDPRDLKIRYVGKTIQPIKKRIYQHMSNHHLNCVKTHKNCWLKSLKKDNYYEPEYLIIDEVNQDEWQEKEIYYINLFKSIGCDLVNGTDGGEGALGTTTNKGYRHTEEAKQRISKANSGPRRKSWVKASAEANKKAIYQLKDDKIIKLWPSATDAAISITGKKDSKKNISSCARGKRKTAYGYT